MAKLNRANNKNAISVIIPKNIIEKLGWKIGDDVVVVQKDKSVVIKNVKDIVE